MNTHSDFASRHIGPQGEERREMLDSLGYRTLDELIADIVPADIRMKAPLDLPAAKSETEALEELRSILRKNKLLKTFIGQGYYGTITPSVILRNVLENPGWYTAYTPYQPEIAQGRLEMLMNFQTMVSSLTGLPVANASLLDEGTAAAEAVTMCRNARPKANTFFVADTCHPQTISVIRTRAAFQGVNIIVGDCSSFDPASIGADLAGVLVQYPDTLGRICDYTDFFSRVHATGALCVVAADLMARRPGLDEEMSMLVETVGQDAARLRTVARQFMEIARMSPSALQLVPDTVDLVERVREWLIPFQLVARESGERLLLSMPETDIPVTIDTERFAWVLSNLVSNALRVGSVGSTVRIVITQEEDDAVLRVEDDGPGIPPELEARLFEPFSHGRTAGTREGLVGLGLAITRDIVEAHGGVIRYARNPGGGAVFTVLLPLAK